MYLIISIRNKSSTTYLCFNGPYETPNICIGAQGLLLLYHYMGEELHLVNEKYRTEVQDVLLDIVNKRNVDQHVYMHDDGEIAGQLEERGDRVLSFPPPGSKYIFTPEVTDADGNVMSIDEFAENAENVKKMLQQAIEMLQKENAEIAARLRAQSEALTDYERLKEEENRKRKRKEAFCVKELITEGFPEVKEENVDVLCRNVIGAFKAAFPEREIFLKRGRTCFYPDDKPIVEALLFEEFHKLQLKLLEEEPMEMGVGVV